MNSEQRIQGMRAHYERMHGNIWSHFISKTSSPIEQLMLGAMLSSGFFFYLSPPSMCADLSSLHEPCEKIGIRSLGIPLCGFGCAFVVIVQPVVHVDGKKITPDFGLVEFQTPPGQSPIAVAVELDGHDFHERTKEQAERDKRRDRSLLSMGWTTIRFTGSEVVRSPETVLGAWVEAVNSERRKRGIAAA